MFSQLPVAHQLVAQGVQKTVLDPPRTVLPRSSGNAVSQAPSRVNESEPKSAEGEGRGVTDRGAPGAWREVAVKMSSPIASNSSLPAPESPTALSERSMPISLSALPTTAAQHRKRAQAAGKDQ